MRLRGHVVRWGKYSGDAFVPVGVVVAAVAYERAVRATSETSQSDQKEVARQGVRPCKSRVWDVARSRTTPEKRSPVIVLRKGSRMLPEVGTFDCMSLWDYSFVSGMVGKNILSLVDIEWLLIVGRRMVGIWLHFV